MSLTSNVGAKWKAAGASVDDVVNNDNEKAVDDDEEDIAKITCDIIVYCVVCSGGSVLDINQIQTLKG